MSLFGKDPPPQQPQPDATFQIGDATRRRIAELRGEDGHGAMFSSDLTVNEFKLVKDAGFDPLGLVFGSSIYHIGYQRTQWAVSQEMQVLSQAMYTARELAMSRMEAEAAALGADGVVAVRLELGRYEWGEDMAEFVAVGTAVRSRDGQSFRTASGVPFTSDLTGQEFAVLRSMGYAPAGLVMGTCVYHIAHQSFRQAWNQRLVNTELAFFTQATYDAREIAMERMQAEAKQLGAEGIVGVDLHKASHGWESHVIEFLAIGTAIVPRPATTTPTTAFVVNVGS